MSSPLHQSPASSTSSSGRQLHFELSQAVERNMVSTRSNDHTPAATERGADEDAHSVVKSGKRKAQQEPDIATPSQSAGKRRRTTKGPKSEAVATPQIATAVVIEVGQSNGNDMRTSKISEPRAEIRPQEATETGTTASTESPQPVQRGSQRPSVELVSTALEQDTDREGLSSKDNNKTSQPPASSTPAKKSKKSKRTKTPLKTPENYKEPNPKTAEDTNTTSPPSKSPKSSHKRFDSAEPEPAIPPPQSHANDNTEKPNDDAPSKDSDESSDDDEAPETITASAGQAAALTAALEESKAAAQLAKERKLKRRERDARLKEQAKAAKKDFRNQKPLKPKGITISETLDPENSPPISPNPQASENAKSKLPTLLPDYLLTDEPSLRPLIPPHLPTSKTLMHHKQQQQRPKKRFLDLHPAPPRDIKKNGVRIRVLQEANTMLPPKSSLQGKALREAWLMGRREGTVVDRRKMRGQGGFVRR